MTDDSGLQFQDVIAPLGSDAFFTEHWNKSFVRIAGTRGRFAGLLDWDELNAILEQHRLAPPRIKLFHNGAQVEAHRFVKTSLAGVPRLDSGGLAVCLAQGATLILNDAQEVAPRVRALTQSFQAALRTDTFVNLYAGWHSQNAFDMHWDPQDSMILQLQGRKRWKVYPPTRLHPIPDEVDPPPKPTGLPAWDGILEDGDALYLPRGWWHVAFPLNEPSLHLTVSMTPPNGIDFLGAALARLRRHPEVRANLPALADASAQAAHLETLKRLLEAELTGAAMTDFLAEWEANIGPAPHIRLPEAPYTQFGAVKPESKVRLAGLHRLPFKPYGENFEFKASGKLWTVPRDLLPALKMLTDAQAFTIAALSGALAGDTAIDNLVKAIAVMAKAGVVLIENS